MAVDTTNWTVSDYLGAAPAVGLPQSRFVPPSFQSQAQVIASRHIPTGAPPSFLTACTASLIARGIIYFKNSPGDCGTPTQITVTNQEAGELAGISIAGMVASKIPVVGSFIAPITAIFSGIVQHHELAVAQEQKVICQVAGVVNQAIAYYDRQVELGLLSPSAAAAGMQAYFNQVNAMLSTILKSCNAACVYQAVLTAHGDFMTSYYQAIAPIGAFSQAPGAAPGALGTVPGGVVQVGGGLAVGMASGAGSYTLSGTTILLLLAAVAVFFVVTSGKS